MCQLVCGIRQYPRIFTKDLQETKREKCQEQQLLVSRRPHRPNNGQRQQEDEKVGAQLDAQDGKVRLQTVTVRGRDFCVPVRVQGNAGCENEAHTRDASKDDHGHEHSERLLDPIIGQGPHVQEQDGDFGRQNGQSKPQERKPIRLSTVRAWLAQILF